MRKLLLALGFLFAAGSAHAIFLFNPGGGGGGGGGSGDITAVTADAPLTGGGTSGSVSVGLDQTADFSWSGVHTFTNFSINGTFSVQGSTYSALISTTGFIEFGSAQFLYATFNVDNAGVNLTMIDYLYVAMAACNNTDAEPTMDVPTSNSPADACLTGSNSTQGVLDFDQSTDESVQFHYLLPPDWTGAIDANFVWTSTTTSVEDVVWGMAFGCSTSSSTYNPAFNTAGSAQQVHSSVANNINISPFATSIDTTGCTAGSLMHVKVFRDADDGDDDMPGDARLLGVNLRIRRTQ